MKIVAFQRTVQGTGASRRLRNQGRTPGILYGAGKPPQPIEFDHNTLWHALKKEAFHSSVLTLEIDGVDGQALLRDVQMHPFRPMVLHVDFQRVDATTKLHMKVPLHFSGDENSPAVKLDACIVNRVITEVEVACFPADLPEFIAVDLSNLKKGTSVHLADLPLPKGVAVVVHGNDKNPVVVSVVAQVAVEAAPSAESAAAQPAKGGKGAAKAPAKPAAAAKK